MLTQLFSYMVSQIFHIYHHVEVLNLIERISHSYHRQLSLHIIKWCYSHLYCNSCGRLNYSLHFSTTFGFDYSSYQLTTKVLLNGRNNPPYVSFSLATLPALSLCHSPDLLWGQLPNYASIITSYGTRSCQLHSWPYTIVSIRRLYADISTDY